jgi:fluoride exporter
MSLYFLIALGGALGSVTRFALNGLISSQFGETFPWGTFLVNVTGSLAIGFFATLTGPEGRVVASGHARMFVMAGIFGGYTTFSSFSLQTLNLAREGEWLRSGANVVGSVIACLVAVWLGHIAATWLNLTKGP